MTLLRGILLTSASWTLLTVSAAAADIPAPITKSPPVLASSWAGFYLGVHGGYGWRNSQFTQLFGTPSNSLGPIKSEGGVFGAHAGYNWQFGRAVTGLELDFSATDIKGSASIPAFSTGPGRTEAITTDDRVRYLGSARGRVGWLPTDTVLLYGTAGLGWERYDRTDTDFRVDSTIAPPATLSFVTKTPFDRFGWVAGAGLEAMLFGPHWIGRIEYLHYDFGRAESATTVTSVGVQGSVTIANTGGRQTIDVVRAGLSYKFGEPAMVSAIPYVKAPIAAPRSSWAGFYLGAHGGYGWGNNDFSNEVNVSLTPPVFVGGIKSQGWIAGGQAGYNWQYDRVVAGLEADFSVSGIKGTASTSFLNGPPVTESRSDNVKYLGTLRGRVGWLPVENVLLYGTAGLGWERLEQTSTEIDSFPPSFTRTQNSTTPVDRFGWVAGVGVETQVFSSNWIGRLEYLHYDFGSVQTFTVTTSSVPGRASVSEHSGLQTIDVVRAGLSYKFGPPAAATTVPYTKAPPMALTSWAGFYLGAHGGYAWKDNDFAIIAGGPPSFGTLGGINSKGWVGGGQVGYNWQNGSVVAGLEIDFSASDITGTSAPFVFISGPITVTQSLSDRVSYLGTARARLGWTPKQNVLLYGTGGLAWERLERTQDILEAAGVNSLTFLQRDAHDYFGWVAGVGAETMPFGPNWVGRLEYLHYDFGRLQPFSSQVSNLPGDFSGADRSGRQTIDLVRAAVSYKFTP